MAATTGRKELQVLVVATVVPQFTMEPREATLLTDRVSESPWGSPLTVTFIRLVPLSVVMQLVLAKELSTLTIYRLVPSPVMALVDGWLIKLSVLVLVSILLWSAIPVLVPLQLLLAQLVVTLVFVLTSEEILSSPSWAMTLGASVMWDLALDALPKMLNIMAVLGPRVTRVSLRLVLKRIRPLVQQAQLEGKDYDPRPC